MTWQLTLSGFLIGALVGMTGMGGGSLLTPILVIFFSLKPTLAVGTDILHGAVFKSFGAVRHPPRGTVHCRRALWMVLGSGPMSLAGVGAATWLKHRYGGAESIEAYAVGVALVVGGIGLVAKTRVRGGVHASDAPFLLRRRDRVIAVAVGATCGFVVGLTSVGSGTFFGLAMLLLFPLTAPKIVGTDITHAAALLWVAGLGHLLHGNVDLHAMGWLLVGSIPGVLLGSQMSIKVPERALRLSFGFVLVLSGLKVVGVPHASIIIVATLAVAAVVLAVYMTRQWLSRDVPAAANR